MKVVVCNIGSSSLKFQLLDMNSESILARGHMERVGGSDGNVVFWCGEEEVRRESESITSHRMAVRRLLQFLGGEHCPAVESLDQIGAVGFKTIQAGEMNGSVLLTDEVLDAMERYRELAPAHNPPYLEAIYMFRGKVPDIPLVGVFEPGFHTGMPEYAKVYGVPYSWYQEHHVLRYGYHGASHRFVTAETVRLLDLPTDDHRVISCHLGGSSSLCAYRNGRSVDTSMGFTPQSGLIQGTRVGDMDPYILPYIMEKEGLSLEEALNECAKNGGLAGLSGISADMRDVKAAVADGDQRAQLAREKYIYDIKRYIGEYLILMEGVDAVAFTGGIGQHDDELREEVLESMRFLGLDLDSDQNSRHAQVITTQESEISAVVMETNEEIVVAREVLKVLNQQG